MNKELEAFARIINHLDLDVLLGGDYRNFAKDRKIVETALIDYESLQEDFDKHYERSYKKLRALDIINNKEIDIALFKECPNIEEYNNWCSNKAALTQEEYDLLKEVLL